MAISITSEAVPHLAARHPIRRNKESTIMNFRLTIHAVAAAGLGWAAMQMAAVDAFCQATNYGPPATSYAIEAARYPNAASKPTPHVADGHPDLSGVRSEERRVGKECRSRW